MLAQDCKKCEICLTGPNLVVVVLHDVRYEHVMINTYATSIMSVCQLHLCACLSVCLSVM